MTDTPAISHSTAHERGVILIPCVFMVSLMSLLVMGIMKSGGIGNLSSKALADRIPNARLQVIEGGGHQFLVERPDDFNRAVLEFLGALPEE